MWRAGSMYLQTSNVKNIFKVTLTMQKYLRNRDHDATTYVHPYKWRGKYVESLIIKRFYKATKLK